MVEHQRNESVARNENDNHPLIRVDVGGRFVHIRSDVNRAAAVHESNPGSRCYVYEEAPRSVVPEYISWDCGTCYVKNSRVRKPWLLSQG